MKLYKFEAPWCQPCKQQKPMLDKLVEDGLDLVTIDISDPANEDMAKVWNISTLPAYYLVDEDGEPAGRKVGPQSEKIMRGWLGL